MPPRLSYSDPDGRRRLTRAGVLQNQRNMEARRRALTELSRRYPDAFAALYADALAAVAAERGPLPEDD